MGHHELKLDDSRRDVILVIGRTGVGKSTMAEIIFGDVTALESTFDDGYLCHMIGNTKLQPGQVEQSMFHSSTICPQLFTDPEIPGLAVYDCPGFADTRGTSNEIATGVYLSEIVRHANQVKLVATVDYDTVKPNADRNKFTDQILPEVLDFVLSNDIYEGGVLLLVTKYNNLNDTNNKFPDDVIVRSIAKFLEAARKYAVEKTTDTKRITAINALFENCWLKSLDGETYPNIGFSRTISSEGKLSFMESLTRRGQIRQQLLDNPHFVFKPSDPKHFGCPISDAAKLEIRKVLKFLCNEAEGLLKSVSQKVVSRFTESAKNHDKLSAFVQQYIKFLNDMIQLTESGLTTKSLEVLQNFCNSVKMNMDSEIDRLSDIVIRLKHLSSIDVEESPTFWEDASGKLNQSHQSMATDLMIEFRTAQRTLTAEANTLLEAVCHKIVIEIAKSSDDSFFDLFQAFSNELNKLTETEAGLSKKKMWKLHEFSHSVGVDMRNEGRKLGGIFYGLQYLTEADTEQSSETWSEVHLIWEHAMEFMKKDIAQMKAQRDVKDAKAQGELAEAEARAETERVKVEAMKDLLSVKAEAEKDRAEVEAKARNDLLSAMAKAEKEKVEAEAKAQSLAQTITETLNAEARAREEALRAKAKAEKDRNKAEMKAREEVLIAKYEKDRIEAEAKAREFKLMVQAEKDKAEAEARAEELAATLRAEAKERQEALLAQAERDRVEAEARARELAENMAETLRAEAKAREEALEARIEETNAAQEASEARHRRELEEASKSNCSIQ